MPDLIVPPELDRMIRRVGSARVQQQVGRVVADSSPSPAGPPRFASLVDTTVRATSAGFAVTSSGTVAKGAEFGGRRGPRKSHITSRKGTRYIVRRRTTMQFLPWVGDRGYAVVPSMRRSLKGIRQRILDAVFEAVTGK